MNKLYYKVVVFRSFFALLQEDKIYFMITLFGDSKIRQKQERKFQAIEKYG